MITVKVKLFASLQNLMPERQIGQPAPLELPAGATLAQMIERLRLPDTKLIFVNGIAQPDLQLLLHAGDEIAVFPLVGGG